MDLRGGLVVFDGGEGSGKSTVIKRLKQAYGDRIAISREPGGCPRAEEIRSYLLSREGAALAPEEQFSLFWEARRYHLEDVIIPVLERGGLLICDRFDSSTWAYQIRAACRPGLAEEFWRQRRRVLDGIEPRYVIFDVAPATGLARAGKRGDTNHFESKALEYHRRVRIAMLEFIALPGIGGMSIDASRPADQVYAHAHAFVSRLLARRPR